MTRLPLPLCIAAAVLVISVVPAVVVWVVDRHAAPQPLHERAQDRGEGEGKLHSGGIAHE